VGVEMREITPEIAASFDLPADGGVLIYSVLNASPAAQAGVQPGDVLLSVDGQDVRASRDMLDRIAATAPGQRTTFRLLRGGKEIELKITVGRRPAPASAR
jgi:S1-C subfamily serine protease